MDGRDGEEHGGVVLISCTCREARHYLLQVELLSPLIPGEGLAHRCRLYRDIIIVWMGAKEGMIE